MRPLPRALLAVVAVTVMLAMLGGCSTEVVCPAVGYSSTLIVKTPASAVDVCTSQGCSDDPAAGVVRQAAESPDAGEHVFTLITAHDTVRVRVASADGSWHEGEHALTWRRVGGSARCGGPMGAQLVLTWPWPAR